MILFFLIDRVTDELLEELFRVHEPQRIHTISGRGKDLVLAHVWRDEINNVVDVLRDLDILDVFVIDYAKEILVPIRKIAVRIA